MESDWERACSFSYYFGNTSDSTLILIDPLLVETKVEFETLFNEKVLRYCFKLHFGLFCCSSQSNYPITINAIPKATSSIRLVNPIAQRYGLSLNLGDSTSRLSSSSGTITISNRALASGLVSIEPYKTVRKNVQITIWTQDSG